jgi:hypothetical protein
MRTTIDIDPAILRELKRRQAEEGKTLGQLVSELLAPVLKPTEPGRAHFAWRTTDSAALVDLEDKEAVRKILDAR